jgi:hypothetical protein
MEYVEKYDRMRYKLLFALNPVSFTCGREQLCVCRFWLELSAKNGAVHPAALQREDGGGGGRLPDEYDYVRGERFISPLNLMTGCFNNNGICLHWTQ